MKKYIDMSISELEERTFWARVAQGGAIMITVVCVAMNVLYTMPLAIVIGFAMLSAIFSDTLSHMNAILFFKRVLLRKSRKRRRRKK